MTPFVTIEGMIYLLTKISFSNGDIYGLLIRHEHLQTYQILLSRH